ASDELAQLAEGGATGPLQSSLEATGKVHASATTGVIFPGTSASVTLDMDDHANRISIAAMMVPTNDGFIGANGIRAPFLKGQSRVVYIVARDAGTEMNDESCQNIPGPHCGGEGYNAAGGEGYVHVHAGIHGEGDLSVKAYDWRNPVAKVTITRMK
ncbi:MAG: spondin domain-containing protein, partial [Gammaproteobacteria bacterium]|nr:spondin domain-containing protein [Gammaproteobacteria bacterium]